MILAVIGCHAHSFAALFRLLIGRLVTIPIISANKAMRLSAGDDIRALLLAVVLLYTMAISNAMAVFVVRTKVSQVRLIGGTILKRI
jgi:hypothetical protein